MKDIERIECVCDKCVGTQHNPMPEAYCIRLCPVCRYITEIIMIAGNSDELEIVDREGVTLIRDRSIGAGAHMCKLCLHCSWCEFKKGHE